jgi:hypothetical protein
MPAMSGRDAFFFIFSIQIVLISSDDLYNQNRNINSTLFHLDNVCWSSTHPNIFTFHSSLERRDLPPNLNYSTFQFQSSRKSWEKVSKKANIFIRKPVSFVFTYQCAFQHVTRELLPHLSYIFGSQLEKQLEIETILFFQEAPYFVTPSWTNSLLDYLTKYLPHPPRFGNLTTCPVIENAFQKKSSCEPLLPYYKPQHVCRPNSDWSFCANTITFANHVWYYDLQSSSSIRKAVLGNAMSHPPTFICLNQRVGTRSISNLKEVHQLLVSQFPNHTIKTYSYEGKSFLEQAHFVNKCKLILHPHSGGETNLIFLHPNSTVIEFFAKYYAPVFYFEELVSSTGSTHIPMIVEDVELPQECEEYRHNDTSCVKPPYPHRPILTRCNFCYKDAIFRVNLNDLQLILQNLSSLV